MDKDCRRTGSEEKSIEKTCWVIDTFILQANVLMYLCNLEEDGYADCGLGQNKAKDKICFVGILATLIRGIRVYAF